MGMGVGLGIQEQQNTEYATGNMRKATRQKIWDRDKGMRHGTGSRLGWEQNRTRKKVTWEWMGDKESDKQGERDPGQGTGTREHGDSSPG